MINYEIMFGVGPNSYQIIENIGNPWAACIVFLRNYLNDSNTLDILDKSHRMFYVTVLNGETLFPDSIEISLYDVVTLLSLSSEC